MDTSIFNWVVCAEADNNAMSADIDMWECKDSPFVAYYIRNKYDILNNYDYSDVYKPLENNFGIYFLMGKNQKGEKAVYIGQASERDTNKGMSRLQEHVNQNTREWYFDSWQSALYITSKSNDWHSGLLNDIEKILIEYYSKNHKYILLNSKQGSKGNSDLDDLRRKLFAILALVSKPKFGYPIENINIQAEITKLEAAGMVAITIEQLEGYQQIQSELKELKNNRSKEQIRLDNYNAYVNWEDTFQKIDIPIYNGRIDERGKEPRYQDVVTPVKIASDMVKGLPAELFNSKTTFIDLYTKSSSILLAIIKRLMSDDPTLPINSEPEFSDKIARINNIIEHQIFGIAGTEPGYINSIKNIKEYVESIYREIYGEKYREFRYCNVILPHIFRLNNYGAKKNRNIVNVDMTYAIKEISLKVSGGTKEDMKFDVIVGNPPYNNDLYIPFVEMGHKLANKYSLWITPATWQGNTDRANTGFKNKIAKYIKELHYFPDCYDVFPVSIISGITYYIIGKKEMSTCIIHNSCIFHNEFNSVEYRDISKGQTLFNIGYRLANKMNVGNSLTIHSNVSDNWCFNISKQFVISGGGFSSRYQDENGHWHVKPNVSGNCSMLFSRTDNTIIVVGNPQIISENTDDKIDGLNNTGISIFSSNDYNEVVSFASYMDCKLVKFMILMGVSTLTCMINNHTYRYVPDPGTFDHIFTDEELYKKYNLTQEEINIIESVIKSRNNSKLTKLNLGLMVNTGSNILNYWLGNNVSDDTASRLQGILITESNVIKSIHIDTTQFNSCKFGLLVNNEQSTWELNPDITNGLQVNRVFSTYLDTLENGYPILNQYKQDIMKRVSYNNGVIDIDKKLVITTQDIMANYVNKLADENNN